MGMSISCYIIYPFNVLMAIGNGRNYNVSKMQWRLYFFALTYPLNINLQKLMK